MKRLKNILLTTLPLTLAFGIGCSSDDGNTNADASCRGDKCDDLDLPDSEVPDSPCDGIMIDESGRNHRKLSGRLHDPLADFVFNTGEDCPVTFQDIMAKLRANDTEGCPDEESGISTRAVSETAQAAGEPTSYRLVTSRRCNGRETHELVFSLFGIRAGASSLPSGVEVMAFDKTAGVFNYYETDGRELHFFGNSHDMAKGAQGTVRRCAACHTGGGLIMKELDTPWIHWEGHMDTPGARELIDAHADLGSRATGSEFEGVVKAGNRAWNETRLKGLRENSSLKEALRPLFCTVEVNIDNGADFESPVEGGEGGSEMSRIPFDSLLDPHLKGFGSISIDFADYDAAIKANGQRIQGIPGAIDTVFDYVFLERAHADNDYVDKLKAAGLIDDEFIKDVLLVDFTRPIFSEDRCDLLEFAPILASADQNADSIRKGFLDNLGNPTAGTPEAELKNNLLTDGGHDDVVDAYTTACTDLGSEALVQNALQITSLNRAIAGNLRVFEFPQTMPTDNLSVAQNSRLSPIDCNVTTDFTAVTAAVTDPEPEPEPDPEPSACPHDICEEGEALTTSNCPDTCAAQICEADAFCCNNTWDNLCVEQVETVCNQECS